MYIFCKYDDYAYAWFKVVGNSMHELVWAYQNGRIGLENILKGGYVCLKNHNNYKFTLHHVYHLQLDYDMNIHNKFEDYEYVADLYMPIIGEICVDKWNEVFRSNRVDVPPLLSEYEEYPNNFIHDVELMEKNNTVYNEEVNNNMNNEVVEDEFEYEYFYDDLTELNNLTELVEETEHVIDTVDELDLKEEHTDFIIPVKMLDVN